MMPLWGVDHWVPLGDLFVDVNILQELSSSPKSKLNDLWQDFTTGMQRYSGDRTAASRQWTVCLSNVSVSKRFYQRGHTVLCQTKEHAIAIALEQLADEYRRIAEER
ncbi:hypothetical protein [Nostoc commune]|uniref:hypothetical protein n=1 Tax=Nostoc commune TaxID=1178 RepID=UPI001E637D01|nr:hypothetical protein [Nostoc commune]